MANTIKVKRGLSSNLSKLSLAEGEMAFATDTKKLYISDTNEPINKDTTYSLSKSGSTITLTGSDGSKTTVTDADTNTTYNAATQSAAGLMSAADKTKLDGIATGANKITVDTAISNSSTNPVQNKVVNAALANKANTSAIPTKVSQLTNDSGFKTTDTNTTYTLSKSGSTITLTGSDGSTNSVTDSNTTYSTATTSKNGLMSSTDKTKLDGIATGATKNTASSTTPKANGTAAAGSESNYARGDHVHPAQTTITGNAGSATKLATARTIAIGTGASGTATNFDGTGNITIPITSMKEAYLNWGGQARAGSISPVDAGCSDIHSANKFQFAKAAGITIEYSRDGGSTWTDLGATDEQKIKLVSNIGNTFYIGNRSAGTTVNDQLRIILNAGKMGLYTSLQKLLINISTNYATGSKVKVERAMKGSTTTYVTMGTYALSGWSGWNSIPISYAFGGGDTQTANIDNLRLTFSITGVNSDTTKNSALCVIDIIAIGMTNWSNPSTMARIGHLYSFDYAQNATFPANVAATTFSGNGANISALNAGNISSGTLSADRLATSGVTAGSYGPTANVSGTNGTTINVPQITVDNKGRVTSVVNRVYTSKDTNTTYSAATTSANGLMSSSDKTKLNGIATGAQVNNVVVSTSQPTASTAEVWINPSGALDLSALWDKLYPVGSVYMSTSSTNPGTLFGGTWAQITGRFLYCTTESKTTGGSATHTHTGPSHSHTYGIALGAFYGAAGYEGSEYTGVLQNGTGDPAGWASWSSANVTNNSSATQTTKTNSNAIKKSTANTGASGTGNTGASSSLPPYFTVYCWYRTA